MWQGELNELLRLQARMNVMFEECLPAVPWREGAGWRPDASVRDSADAEVFDIDLAGADMEQTTVEIANGLLRLQGAIAEDTATAERYFVRERRTGRFFWSQSVPAGAAEGVRAVYRDGIMRIAVPRGRSVPVLPAA